MITDYYVMRKNKLIFWFIGWFIVMLIIGYLTQPEVYPSKLDIISFETTESAELYFKNVRAFYYEMSPEGEGVFEAYRLYASLDEKVDASLVFVIYNNWRHNLAFIRIDTNMLPTKRIDHVVSLSPEGAIDTLFLPEPINESQYNFAKEVYQATQRRNRIALISQNDSLWISESATGNLRKTLRDYFKLVGKL